MPSKYYNSAVPKTKFSKKWCRRQEELDGSNSEFTQPEVLIYAKTKKVANVQAESEVNFQVLFLNVQGLPGKEVHLEIKDMELDLDVVCLAEHWLQNNENAVLQGFFLCC